MTYGMTSCNSQAAGRSAAVAMTAVTLKSRIQQMRDDLQRLREAQLDCCNCVQQDISEALRNIQVGIVNTLKHEVNLPAFGFAPSIMTIFYSPSAD